jgi:hypothetical protein
VLVGRREQLLSVRRQGHMTSRPLEQPKSQLMLELSNQDAQPGWRDEERVRRAREAVVLRDQMKGLELSRREIHY